MPRSLKGKLKKAAHDAAMKYLEQQKEIYMSCVTDVINEQLDKTLEDINIIFENSIEQFYDFRTSRYSRYGTGIGSGTGERLFYANLSHRDENGIHIMINASRINSEMPYSDQYKNEFEGEIGYDKRNVSGDEVLDRVMNGIRFYRPKYGDMPEYTMSWSLDKSIKTSFNRIRQDTPKEVLDEYIKRWNKGMPSRIRSRVNKLYKLRSK